MDEIERGEHGTIPLQNTEITREGLPIATAKRICFTKMPVYQAQKSLFVTCSFGGLIFIKNASLTGIKRYLSITQVYSLLVFIFYIANVLRLFSMYDGNEAFGIDLFLRMSHCVWSVETVGHYVASVTACLSDTRLPGFFIEWEKIRGECSQNVNSITKLSYICTCILCLLILANSTFCAYTIFFTNVQDFNLTPWDRNFKYVIMIQVLNAIQQFYGSFAWFGLSMQMFIICKQLAYEFQAITHRIEILSRDHALQRGCTMEKLRRHHQNLCKLVSKADDVFSSQIALSLSGSVITSCLELYIIVYDDDPLSRRPLVIMIRAFWVLICFVKVIFDCISGTILHEAVSYYHSNE